MKCDMKCFECKYDDCINDNDADELEKYINARNEKETKELKVDPKTRKRLWYMKNRERALSVSRVYHQDRRQYRIKHKMCVMCGKKLAIDYRFKNCEKCREKIIEANHKHKEKRSNADE